MSRAFVNPNMLRWARDRADLSLDVLAGKIGTRADRVRAWEMGEMNPTFRQAQIFSRAAHIPFGYLFLSTPPQESLPIPDLRTVRDEALGPPSTDFRDLISDVMRKWDWFKDYLRDQDRAPLTFVGRFNQNSSVEDVAADISRSLEITDGIRESSRSWEEFLNRFIEKAEGVGIWVMRNGIVGNNTHRPLQVEEFRGFAISDPNAPLIFLNGRDARAAQIFTLAHELSHIWIGQSGISNVSLGESADAIGNEVEQFCNRVAAELLVPRQKILERWDHDLGLTENANNLTRYFRVSSVVVARRALDLQLVEWDTYWRFFEEQRDIWRRAREQRTSGGDFYRTLKVRSGTVFSRAVLSSAYEGQLLFRDAATLLGVKVGLLERFAREMNVR